MCALIFTSFKTLIYIKSFSSFNLFILVLLIIFSFRSGSPPGADPGAESPCLIRAAYRNPMCQRANNSPLHTHEDWGNKNAIAPFYPGPVPLPDGTKQHGEPIKLPSDPRSREDTANGVSCLIQNGQTAASVSGSDPSPESTGKEQPAHAGIRSPPREEKYPRTHEKDEFCGQKAKNSPSTILNHRRYLYRKKYVEESDDARIYEYALKWKTNLHQFRSSEDTYMPVYVYDQITLRQDYQSSFWGRSRNLQYNSKSCVKQSYERLTCQNIFSYSGTRRSLGS